MAYAASFHRLVLAGEVYGDIWNTSLSIIQRTGTGTIGLPPVADLNSGIKSAIDAFYGATGGTAVQCSQAFLISSFKLNNIGTDGKYTHPGPGNEVVFSPYPGSGAFTPPSQLATVATLRTAVARGRGSKGRMYLPVAAGFQTMDTNGQAATSAAQRVADAVRIFINSINAVYLAQKSGDEALGRVGVTSALGSGAQFEVTKVTVGRVTDTIRSRRNKIDEDPAESAAIA